MAWIEDMPVEETSLRQKPLLLGGLSNHQIPLLAKLPVEMADLFRVADGLALPFPVKLKVCLNNSERFLVFDQD